MSRQALVREEEKRQRPHDQDTEQEQDAGLRETKCGIETGGSQNRQHQQREEPLWDGEPVPE